MKAGRVPLSAAAVALLEQISEIRESEFRSTFRDWATERTSFPHEVAKMALAHTVGDKVEAAYRRGDLFQKRGQLMAAGQQGRRPRLCRSAAAHKPPRTQRIGAIRKGGSSLLEA
jgi:hypothetical protein